MDLNNLKTTKGTKIQIHLEAEPLAENFGYYKTQEKFERMMTSQVYDAIDTGPDTTVHLLFSIKGDCAVLSESKFAEWDKNPAKDWDNLPDVIWRVCWSD